MTGGLSPSAQRALGLAIAGLLGLEAWFLVDVDAVFAYGYGDVGTVDFASYWAALRALAAGADPYDPAAVGPIQAALGREGPPVIMYNPPWTLGYLAPVLALPLSWGAACWMLATLVALGAVVAWGLRELGAPPLAVVAAFAFHPLVSIVMWGQSTTLAAVGLSGAWVALVTRRDLVAGLFLALATTKPHLALPFGLAALWTAVVERRPRILVGAVAGLLPPLALVLALSPGVLGDWLASFSALRASDAAVASTDYHTASLASQLIAQTGIEAFRWAIPALGLALTAGWLLRVREVPWARAGPWLLGLGFLAAPFGWFYDMTALVWLHVLAVAAGLRTAHPRPIAAALAVQVASVGGWAVGVLDSQDDYWWVPLGLIAAWAVARSADPAILDRVSRSPS